MTTALADLIVYPIKSAGGMSVAQWEVDDFGLRHDRRFMVVDHSGEFLTQRLHPRLALVSPRPEGDRLRINAPDMPELRVPLQPEPVVVTQVTVWDDVCAATWLGESAAEWFSDFLGRSCSLVHMHAQTRRPTNPAYDRTGSRVSFADAFPFLIISEASLADLNRRLADPIPMNRFRPNLTISGGDPYQEDCWTQIQIGSLPLNVVKPCARCVITTTDQATGNRGVEPLRTLATYRNTDGKVMFGQNAVHEGGGSLRVGDPLVVTQLR